MRTRREFLTVTVVLGAAAALGPRSTGAAPKSMSVLHESSFIKAFDEFFVKKLALEYEKLTGIKINYEPVSVGSLLTRMTTEIGRASCRERVKISEDARALKKKREEKGSRRGSVAT